MDLENHYEGGWFDSDPALAGGRIWDESDARHSAWTAVCFILVITTVSRNRAWRLHFST